MEPGPVWVVDEQHQGALASLTRRLTGEARRLAGRLGSSAGLILFSDDLNLAPTLAAHGADAVYLIDGPAPLAGDPRPAVDALSCLIARHRPALVLFAATRLGSELAARTAARLDLALIPRCARLELRDDGALEAERPAYAGRATATVRAPPSRTALATLAPDTLPPDQTDDRRATPELHCLTTSLTAPLAAPPRVSVEAFWRPGPWEMDLTEAEVIVAGGRGAATADDFQLLAGLAELLGGAVAASRPAVDTGIAPYHRQVGLSGRTVAPRLYIACAISGAMHHVFGMRGAEAVIAINRDPHAPIFDLADLGIVADFRDVVPAIAERIRRMKETDESPATDAIVGAFGERQVGTP